MQSWDKSEDFSDTIISNEKGVLSVRQQGVGKDLIFGNDNKLLRLKLEALNRDITVSEIKAERTGVGDDSDVENIRLEDASGNTIAVGTTHNGIATFQPDLLLHKGQNTTHYIEVDISDGAISENTIGFRIRNNHDIVTDKGTVSIRDLAPGPRYNDVSYISNIPSQVKVDGAFADWDKEIKNDEKGDEGLTRRGP